MGSLAAGMIDLSDEENVELEAVDDPNKKPMVLFLKSVSIDL